jgi:DNA-binding response OmpR family regulator
MNRKGRILIVDDQEHWRKALVEILERGGFHTDSASSTSEALECLQKYLYHLLVLDIRLVDIAGNKEGMGLLGELERRGLSEATKVIMLSAYGTQEYMRTSFTEYNVMDFLSKDDFDNEEFLREVRKIFSEKVKINLALDIHWPQASRPEQIVLTLNVDGTSVHHDSPLRSQVVVELEDLFCRLFRQAKSVLVRPSTAGWSGTGVLRALPFYPTGGGGYEVIVKFGDFHKIEEEYRNFTEYVQPFLGGERNTTIIAMRRTPHLAGIMYSLLGTTNDQVVDFGEFYHHADIFQIKEALDRLFWHTCKAWYASRGQLELVDLTADYQRLFSYPLETIKHVLSDQQNISVRDDQKLSFKSLPGNRAFTDPLPMIDGLSVVYPTYCCITHGDFNHHNLLVDSDGNMWLVDFQGTGPGHILRDVASLDSAVRFQLLTAEEATLEERLRMEEALLDNIQRFSQVDQLRNKFSTTNRALAKAHATVIHLRTVARKLVEANPDDDISEYYIALLYNALNTLRFSSLSSIQREHALLCASLLADRLGLGSQ